MAMPLWDSQKKALEKMSNGCILAGGVGSGKSRTAIAYWARTGIQDVYVITTAMKRDSMEWESDFTSLSLYHDGVKDNIHIDSWNRISHYENVNDALFIFDEQRLVGSGAWVKSFLKIARNNQWVLLSGTPGDTWLDYIPVFIANGYYKNRTEFLREHVVFDRYSRFPKVDRFIGTRKLEYLQKKILVEMPVKRHTTRHIEQIYCEYDKDIYRDGTKNRFDVFKKEPMQNISALCMFQRKVVNLSEDRFNKVVEIVINNPKVIIFYNFDYELERLRTLSDLTDRRVFERNGHNHHVLDEELDKWIYLVQYSSGSEAWNCITTNVMVFYSQTYSWKVREQAMGRIDRMNTPYRDLYYYELTSASTIDNAIRKSIDNKRVFNEKSYSQTIERN